MSNIGPQHAAGIIAGFHPDLREAIERGLQFGFKGKLPEVTRDERILNGRSDYSQARLEQVNCGLPESIARETARFVLHGRRQGDRYDCKSAVFVDQIEAGETIGNWWEGKVDPATLRGSAKETYKRLRALGLHPAVRNWRAEDCGGQEISFAWNVAPWWVRLGISFSGGSRPSSR